MLMEWRHLKALLQVDDITGQLDPQNS